jgi:MerR family transcriptional regulator/heat shock protein HspR
MRDKIGEIEAEVSRFLEFVRKEFFQGRDEEFEARKSALVKAGPTRLIKIDRTDA